MLLSIVTLLTLLPQAAASAQDVPDLEINAFSRGKIDANVAEIEALCLKIYEIIRKKRPPDEDSLVDAEPEKMATDGWLGKVVREIERSCSPPFTKLATSLSRSRGSRTSPRTSVRT